MKDLKVSYDTISHVISEFLDKEYLEDKKFIEAFVSMHERQGRGPYWISQKLKAIGVLEEEFSAYFSSSKESLRELFEKKTVKLDLKDPKIKRKLIAFFLRRGFSFEEILEVLAQDDYGSATKRF